MSYKNNEIMRLDLVKELNINPVAILDVGAHTGQFYNWAKGELSKKLSQKAMSQDIQQNIQRIGR